MAGTYAYGTFVLWDGVDMGELSVVTSIAFENKICSACVCCVFRVAPQGLINDIIEILFEKRSKKGLIDPFGK